MRCARSHRQLGRSVFAIGVLLISLTSSLVCAGQASNPAADEVSKALEKYPGLLPEFGHLAERLQRELKLPAPRAESRLLPLLPESTVVYAALPNYGDVSHQALQIFHQELQSSAVLRDWWRHADPATSAKVEEFLNRFYDVSQYLGDEVAISGSMSAGQPSLLMVAEIRKPGLKSVLEQMLKELGGEKPGLVVLDSQELANAKDQPGQPVVLVRADFLVAGINLVSVRDLSARIDRKGREFASTAFGRRLTQSYDGGATAVAAVDLQTVLSQVPPQVRESQAAFERTGITDAKYLVWEHKTIAGTEVSQGELSFTGPRRGVAAWLAKAGPLGSLDFASPKSMLTASIALSNPAQIYDDLQELATATNPTAFANVAQMEQMLGLSLRNDLLGRLGGEIMVEVDSLTPVPAWKLVLSVKDADRLQQTLNTLMSLAHMQPESSTQEGRTYYSITVPTPARPIDVAYTFTDGYLLIGSGRDTVAEAIRLHNTGESLAKSKSFLASLPPGHSSGLSGLFYEDPAALMALQMRQMAPGSAGLFSSLMGHGSPLVICAYGEDQALREGTTSAAFDPSFVLIGAAVAIPNLLRAKVSANEAAAVGTLRTVNTAQITYASSYPQRTYARDLATLGPDPNATTTTASPDHASLIDSEIGNPSCTGTNWCVKNGYRFRVTGSCIQRKCREFVAFATPVTSNTGGKNFCSTSDGVIHAKPGAPMLVSVTASQCRAWPPLE